ncbi:MAG: recombinase family protein [Phycisphaerales bacterium]
MRTYYVKHYPLDAESRPAAQYIRMSTEHQHTPQNQADVIREYAQRRGYCIVKTYADCGQERLLYIQAAAVGGS